MDDLNQRVQHSPACVYLYNSEHRSPPISHVLLGGPGCVCNIPAEYDLNQRVEARLKIFEGIAAGENWLIYQNEFDATQAWALFLRSEAGKRMPASWRDRWQRHNRLRPYNAGVLGKRYVCVYDGHHDPCPDKQAVLREIGVEP